MANIEQLRALNAHFRRLRDKEKVYLVELHATNGKHGISNTEIINKIVDLLIKESQTQIEKEIEG